MKTNGIDLAKGFVDEQWSPAMGTGKGRAAPWLAGLGLIVLGGAAGSAGATPSRPPAPRHRPLSW